MPLKHFFWVLVASSLITSVQADDSANPVLAEGEYLARAANCIGCHTENGAAELAGGKPIHTPFGTVYSSNITPHLSAGIGGWSADDFWQALHEGRSRDGQLLYPAFPYTHFTQITRADSDALWQWLQTVKPDPRPATSNTLRFPFNTQLALRVWRALFFKAGAPENEPKRSQQWSRGRYLVEALGHCNACHGERNMFGAASTRGRFAGALLPNKDWHAPPLGQYKKRTAQEHQQLVVLLKTGVSSHGVASGPMADVVAHSLQYLREDDLGNMIDYIDSLPPAIAQSAATLMVSPAMQNKLLLRGDALYQQYCSDCHGAQGQGEAGVFPPLANNPLVLAPSPGNVLRSIKFGGYSPSTAGNPYPFGMPPYAHQLSHKDIAAVATYIRQSWGNQASAVSPAEVAR